MANDSSFSKLQDALDALLASAAAAERNTGLGRSFWDDARFASTDDVLALFDRADLLVRLKTLLTQEHNAADWAAPKSQMEYLAGWERDFHALQRNRLDRYRAATQEKTFVGTSVDQYADEVARIESQQTSS